MSLQLKSYLAAVLGLGVFVVALAEARQDQPPPPPPEEAQTQPGVEVQTRGPVHEAFAEPADSRPEPTPLVTKEPPAPVDEVPPEERPEGDDDVWIPGYWAYDDDASNFIWVSGIWRMPPPGRQWVPGSWQEVEGGWHWVPGYWAAGGQDETEYLPAPPPTLDNGPSSPAPDEASDYVPGCWVYREARYRWRPGFWLAHRPGWCWMAPRYVWSTLGYVFVEGYWDRPLLDRGLCFAPVIFDQNVIAAQGFQYVPSYAVMPDFLMSCLFARPATCQYYFGDYFEDRYTRRGFVPWIDYRVGRAALDPNFAYYRSEFAREPRWEKNLRALYADRFSGSIPRPPRTLAQQMTELRKFSGGEARLISKNINITNVQNVTAVSSLRRLNNLRVTALANLAAAPGERAPAEGPRVAGEVVKLQRMSSEERTREQHTATAVRALAKQRAEGEGRLLRETAEGKQPADARRALRLERPKDVPVLNAPRSPGQEKAVPVARPEPRPEARPGQRPPEKTPQPMPTERPRQTEPAPRPTERPEPREPAPARPVEQPRQAAPPAAAPPRLPAAAPPHEAAPPRRSPPPQPTMPQHEDRPIPQHQPPPAPRPPAAHPAPPPAKAEPPHKEEPKKK
jgi:hypothetical protein